MSCRSSMPRVGSESGSEEWSTQILLAKFEKPLNRDGGPCGISLSANMRQYGDPRPGNRFINNNLDTKFEISRRKLFLCERRRGQ